MSEQLSRTPAKLRAQTANVSNRADALVRRLAWLYPHHEEPDETIEALIESTYAVAGHEIFLHESQQPREAWVLLRGLACRTREINTGRRQITGFVLPGDFCDFGFVSSSATTPSIMSIGPSVVGKINLETLAARTEQRPNIMVATMRGAAIERAMVEELVVSLGARDAIQRLAHLLCEICYRLRIVGLVDHDNRFEFPVTQAELGEALGLSTVHVNRTLQLLRRNALIAFQQGSVVILDWAGLAETASFNERYLAVK